MTSKRRRPLARYVRMTSGWGYLCPRCRDIIMFDRELQLYGYDSLKRPRLDG